MGAKVPGNKSSRERKFPRTFLPGNQSSRERIGLLTDSLQGGNWPRSEKAQYRLIHRQSVWH